jgi:hypothetical protein
MGLGQGAHLLHALEEGAALLLDEGLAQEIAQAMDLLGEGTARRPA